MKMIAVTCALMCASAFGAVMPQLPEPAHADTEVWMNVPCAQLLSDVREFETVLDFTGTASNCVQVAFGRDENGDGDLSWNEGGRRRDRMACGRLVHRGCEGWAYVPGSERSDQYNTENCIPCCRR